MKKRVLGRLRASGACGRAAVLLLLAAISVAWASSVCSAQRNGSIELSGFVIPTMELVMGHSVIEWEGLQLGWNVCPIGADYSVLSNVPFKVTIRSDYPRMRVKDLGPMEGATLMHPLEWSADLSGCFTPMSKTPATVLSADHQTHFILHTIEFRQEIDIADRPPLDSNQRYESTIILSVEPTT